MNKVRRNRHVVVRTHGGLGNQIFQLLYARLVAGDYEPRVVHDAAYPHAFGLSEAFENASRPGKIGMLFSAIRVPKVLERIRFSDNGTVRIGQTLFMDGYFQDPKYYARYPGNDILKQLNRLARELKTEFAVAEQNELHHIRLGDFFPDEAAQRAHLSERLNALPPDASIMTNREDLVAEALGREPFASRNLSIVPTSGAAAEQVLRLMSRYAIIVSNDSTLAFWAACLANRKLVTPSPILMALYAQLGSIVRPPAALSVRESRDASA